MNLDELAATRRSVRKYKDAGMTAVEARAQVEAVLEFVRANAPSWKNSQTHRYYAALSEEKMAAVRGALSEGNRSKSEHAAALVVSAFERDVAGFTNGTPDNELGNGWGAYDLGLSDSLFILKARDLGLDTLIMGLRDADRLREVLGIPGTQAVGAVISVGVRAGEAAMPGRLALSDIATFL